ncbi:hypothetical protein [Methylocystis sp.]|uniref:hypothetical protein n=1 Tax=Methylocystis sp. TaxID=1911079 RepID=UPI003D122E11
MKTEPEADEADTEDYRRAIFIQQKAQFGVILANRLSDPNEDHDTARHRYAHVREELIAALDLIEDEFLRGFSAHQIIKMCKAGNDEIIARALLICVRDEFIREKIFEDFPELRASRNSA